MQILAPLTATIPDIRSGIALILRWNCTAATGTAMQFTNTGTPLRIIDLLCTVVPNRRGCPITTPPAGITKTLCIPTISIRTTIWNPTPTPTATTFPTLSSGFSIAQSKLCGKPFVDLDPGTSQIKWYAGVIKWRRIIKSWNLGRL